MTVDLDALKADLWKRHRIESGIDRTIDGEPYLVVLVNCDEASCESMAVWESGEIDLDDVSGVGEFCDAIAIIARHVAPAEPVTLTAEESADLDDLLHKWVPFTDRIPQPSQMVETWLRERGFRLVRTGGAE